MSMPGAPQNDQRNAITMALMGIANPPGKGQQPPPGMPPQAQPMAPQGPPVGAAPMPPGPQGIY
jgi:hypothetical protein